ncbi:hypothetical protein [Virgibacillus ainsalahensis]
MKSKIIILIMILLTIVGIAIAYFWMQHILDERDMSAPASLQIHEYISIENDQSS